MICPPLSSISSDDGVSSSCILVPSYKNLYRTSEVSVIFKTREQTALVQSLKTGGVYKPDAINVLANLACIGPLELAKLGTPLDFEKDLLASSTHNLTI